MSEEWVVGTCWGCGSANLNQAPDYRSVGEPKFYCRNCRAYFDSVRPLDLELKSRFSDTHEATELAYEMIGDKKPESSEGVR